MLCLRQSPNIRINDRYTAGYRNGYQTVQDCMSRSLLRTQMFLTYDYSARIQVIIEFTHTTQILCAELYFISGH